MFCNLLFVLILLLGKEFALIIIDVVFLFLFCQYLLYKNQMLFVSLAKTRERLERFE